MADMELLRRCQRTEARTPSCGRLNRPTQETALRPYCTPTTLTICLTSSTRARAPEDATRLDRQSSSACRRWWMATCTWERRPSWTSTVCCRNNNHVERQRACGPAFLTLRM